jgi:hypothetical protein
MLSVIYWLEGPPYFFFNVGLSGQLTAISTGLFKSSDTSLTFFLNLTIFRPPDF